MKGKAVIPLVLGLCVGLIAVKFGLDAIKSAQASGTKRDKVTAVRAVHDIDPFIELRAEMLEEVETEVTSLLPRAELENTIEKLVGRVSGKPIAEGSPILASMLAPEGTAPGLQGTIQPGYRAVSVKIDEVTGVAYQVKPGDWVDVIVVMDVKSNDKQMRLETVAEVILQHVQVAAIGMSAPGPTTEKPSGKMIAAKSATLLVPESDVPKLHLASSRGKITLALRGTDELVNDTVASARSDELLKSLRSALEPEEAEADVDSIELTGEVAPQPPVAYAHPLSRHNIMLFRDTTQIDALREVERISFATTTSRSIVGVSRGALAEAGAGASDYKPSEPESAPSSETEADDQND